MSRQCDRGRQRRRPSQASLKPPSVTELGLGTRIENALLRDGIETIDRLIELSETELLRAPKLGER